MSERLIERDRELALIDAAIARVAGGEGTLMLIEGPIGVGKSALLGAVREAAGRAGIQVLVARGGEVERGLGWGVVRDLFQPAIGGLAADRRDRLFRGAAARAAAVLDLGQAGELSSEEAVASAMHGLYWTLAGMVGDSGAALVVDDVHWSDEPSLRWLIYLAARLRGLPVLLSVAIRDGDPRAASSRDALLAASADHTSIRPTALTRVGAAQLTNALLNRRTDPEFAEACFVATGGNPLLLGQLAQALQAEGVDVSQATSSSLSSFELSDVARSVLVRIGRLAPEAREVAAAAAVLGSNARLSHISELVEIDERAAAEAADALSAAGIFSGATPIEFVHPIVRAAVYEDIPQHRRSELHLRASRQLGRGWRAAEISAIHLLSVSPANDPKISETLVAGADLAMQRGAAASAVLYLRRAIEEHDQHYPAADLHHRLGIAAIRAGYIDEGFNALRRAFELEDDPRVKAQVAVELASRLTTLGTGQAMPFLEHTLHRLGRQSEARKPVEALYLGLAILWVDKFEAAIKRLRELYGRRGERTDDPLVLATLAAATSFVNDEPADTVVLLANRAAQAGLIARQPLNHVIYASTALVFGEAFDDAEQYWNQAVEDAQQHRGPLAYALAVLYRSLLHLRRGKVSSAEADAQSAIDVLEQHGAFQPDAVVHLSEALLERDQPDEALQLLERVWPLPQALAGSWQDVHYRAARGRVLQATGSHANALEEFEACNQTHFGANPAVLRTGFGAALAQHSLGNLDQARAIAEQQLTAARQFGAPGSIGIALRTLGAVLGGEAGIEHLRSAEAILAREGAHLEHAKAQLEFGAALRRAGHRGEALSLLRLARRSGRECGAVRVARQARDELLVAGARPRRDELRGRDVLTASEQRVASMAADGKSNAQIAQELFVTLRTVETHLTHVYQKLDIPGRAQLPQALQARSESIGDPEPSTTTSAAPRIRS